MERLSTEILEMIGNFVDLIRRLCSSPELASLVRHFAFRIGGYDDYGKDELPQGAKRLPDQRTYEGHPKSLIDHFPASLKTLKITDIGFHYITALLLDVVGLLKERTSMPSLEQTTLMQLHLRGWHPQ
ncbi:oxidoreductase, 2OG-Fe(II) oxygenase family [Aspergillus luchuensis]|uniref:Oxidoreductase, 2OG-Fe(II) oxygenase family n=1 Tax=Aspergillus kawachii TaxID=1069201 RepID=A0A146FEG3_ASPKA|nr:oxidoreductase, 2OG-Fe(II) oxygenase family [Aspergillus luchuensis]